MHLRLHARTRTHTHTHAHTHTYNTVKCSDKATAARQSLVRICCWENISGVFKSVKSVSNSESCIVTIHQSVTAVQTQKKIVFEKRRNLTLASTGSWSTSLFTFWCKELAAKNLTSRRAECISATEISQELCKGKRKILSFPQGLIWFDSSCERENFQNRWTHTCESWNVVSHALASCTLLGSPYSARTTFSTSGVE
jgi:hypothetical protein